MVSSTTILWLLVGLAAVWDVSQRRIPNRLVVIGLLLGAAFQTQSSGIAGLGLALLGAATGLALLILPFVLRVMGGGDVKLTMLCGAFLGWLGVIEVTLIASVLHGALAVGVIMARRVTDALGRPPPTDKLPYAVSVAIATVLFTAGLIQLFPESSTLLPPAP